LFGKKGYVVVVVVVVVLIACNSALLRWIACMLREISSGD